MRCPKCGVGLFLALLESDDTITMGLGDDWQRREGQVMAAGHVTVAPGASYEKRQPARPSDVRETLQYSAWSGFVLAIAGAVFAVLFKQIWIFIASSALGVIVFVVLWFVLMYESRRLLWIVERITGRDIDGDGSAGRPRAADPPIILRAPNARASEAMPDFASMTVDASSPNRRLALDLAEFLTLGERTVGFGIRDWTGRKLSSGTYVSDSMWRQWTDTLKTAGILESDNSGTRLVVDLDTALRAIIVGQ